jgi:hypothetical protein
VKRNKTVIPGNLFESYQNITIGADIDFTADMESWKLLTMSRDIQFATTVIENIQT